MTELQVGDVVRLKSGGQRMTVENIGSYGPIGPESGAKCVWFDSKGNPCEQVFAVAVLEKISPPGLGASMTVTRA